MSDVLDYINNQNLDLITWLDADISNINISGNIFTWSNKANNTNYDFIQSNINLHPVINANGITFNTNSFLFSRASNIIDANQYTLIFINKNSVLLNQLLLSIQQTFDNAENILKYKWLDSSLIQEYQRLYLKTTLLFDEIVSEDINTLGIVHDIKRGYTIQYANNTSPETLRNIHTFYRFDSDKTIIGKGNLNNLYHLLIFNGRLSQINIVDIIELLILNTPALNPNPYWDLISTEIWNNLSETLWNNIL